MKTTLSIAGLLIGFPVGASSAATLLYSENFNGEGTNYNAGTTPETNVGGIGVLQSTGTAQGGNAGNTAWSYSTGGAGGTTGQRGLRFGSGGGYNWATGSNAALILADGGFSISFNYELPGTVSATDWMSVRVGNGGENTAINAADVDFGVLARANGQIQTFENGAAGGYGTATAAAPRSAQFNYAFSSWAAGATVTFTGIIDGTPIASDTFTWDGTNDVRIVFGGQRDGTLIDNIVVSTIPEPSSALLGALGALGLLRRRRN